MTVRILPEGPATCRVRILCGDGQEYLLSYAKDLAGGEGYFRVPYTEVFATDTDALVEAQRLAVERARVVADTLSLAAGQASQLIAIVERALLEGYELGGHVLTRQDLPTSQIKKPP